MSRFETLLEQLEADIETVLGERVPIVWRFSPLAKKEERWSARIDIPRRLLPYAGDCLAVGHDGETPMCRLAEDFAAKAHLVRERSKGRKK